MLTLLIPQRDHRDFPKSLSLRNKQYIAIQAQASLSFDHRSTIGQRNLRRVFQSFEDPKNWFQSKNRKVRKSVEYQ